MRVEDVNHEMTEVNQILFFISLRLLVRDLERTARDP